jgi:hypothetical protein
VKAAAPALALDGERELTVGTGLEAGLIVKVRAADVPPPGAGFCTATLAVPEELRSAAGICADSELLEANVVGTMLPFHNT